MTHMSFDGCRERVRRAYVYSETQLGPALTRKMEVFMAWKTPKIVEIAVGLEINSYACAEIK